MALIRCAYQQTVNLEIQEEVFAVILLRPPAMFQKNVTPIQRIYVNPRTAAIVIAIVNQMHGALHHRKGVLSVLHQEMGHTLTVTV